MERPRASIARRSHFVIPICLVIKERTSHICRRPCSPPTAAPSRLATSRAKRARQETAEGGRLCRAARSTIRLAEQPLVASAKSIQLHDAHAHGAQDGLGAVSR